MCSDSGAKRHFTEFSEITANLLFITATFYSVSRVGRNTPLVKTWVLLVKNGNALVLLWLYGLRRRMLVNWPVRSRDSKFLPACPGENPFQTSKLLIPSIRKHLISTGEAWNLSFHCDCYPNVELIIVILMCQRLAQAPEGMGKGKIQICWSRIGCHNNRRFEGFSI